MKCARCEEKACYQGKDCTAIAEPARDACRQEDVSRMMRAAASLESSGYGVLTRVEELAQFARSMGYRRLGLAFCIGLSEEARLLHEYYAREGFRVYSVCCKLCGITKDSLGLERRHPEWDKEATCNPVGQAMQLRRCRTELNVIVGLCVGHDILFTRYSEAPVTALIVKDRVLSHNPAAVLYSSYGRGRLRPASVPDPDPEPSNIAGAGAD